MIQTSKGSGWHQTSVKQLFPTHARSNSLCYFVFVLTPNWAVSSHLHVGLNQPALHLHGLQPTWAANRQQTVLKQSEKIKMTNFVSI